MTVALVIVSHSARLAAGVRELAAQMAPGVHFEVAGGVDGSLGTSFDLVSTAIADAVAASVGSGVVGLYDLGSALLTAETALELSESDLADRVTIVDAPLVEGAVAAAVAAAGGADRDGVAGAARKAVLLWQTAQSASPGAEPAPGATTTVGATATPVEPSPTAAVAMAPERRSSTATTATLGPVETATASAVIGDADGIHARPAAQLGLALNAWPDAVVTIEQHGSAAVDVRDTLRLIGLGVRADERVAIAGRGPGSAEAVRSVAELLRSAGSRRNLEQEIDHDRAP